MINIIKRWLGTERETLASSGLEPPRRPTAATATVLTNGRPTQKGQTEAPARPGPGPSEATLSLDIGSDGQSQEAFDPYNTGRFDRSAFWEHVSRRQR